MTQVSGRRTSCAANIGELRARGLTVVAVPCGRTTHRIALTPGGALLLLDHRKKGVVRSELAACELGGEVPACVQILSAWRRNDRNKLPADLCRERPPSRSQLGGGETARARYLGARLYHRLARRALAAGRRLPALPATLLPEDKAYPLACLRHRTVAVLRWLCPPRTHDSGDHHYTYGWYVGGQANRHASWEVLLRHTSPDAEPGTAPEVATALRVQHPRRGRRHYGTRGGRIQVLRDHRSCVDVQTSDRSENVRWLADEIARLALGYQLLSSSVESSATSAALSALRERLLKQLQEGTRDNSAKAATPPSITLTGMTLPGATEPTQHLRVSLTLYVPATAGVVEIEARLLTQLLRRHSRLFEIGCRLHH